MVQPAPCEIGHRPENITEADRPSRTRNSRAGAAGNGVHEGCGPSSPGSETAARAPRRRKRKKQKAPGLNPGPLPNGLQAIQQTRSLLNKQLQGDLHRRIAQRWGIQMPNAHH